MSEKVYQFSEEYGSLTRERPPEEGLVTKTSETNRTNEDVPPTPHRRRRPDSIYNSNPSTRIQQEPHKKDQRTIDIASGIVTKARHKNRPNEDDSSKPFNKSIQVLETPGSNFERAYHLSPYYGPSQDSYRSDPRNQSLEKEEETRFRTTDYDYDYALTDPCHEKRRDTRGLPLWSKEERTNFQIQDPYDKVYVFPFYENSTLTGGLPKRSRELNAWQKCVENKKISENEANELLIKGTIPSQQVFVKICYQHGRKSSIVRCISSFICQKIKEQSNKIVDVWPAYQYEKDSPYNRIVFVVITKGDIDIETDYQFYQRKINEISSIAEKENSKISVEEKLNDIRIDEITHCLKSNAKHLMEKHKNLTWVTVSGIKSSGIRKNHNTTTLPCIALYVHIKGFIPMGEDPFEQFLDGYPIDVREGVFTLCGSSTDFHQHVRIGCAINSGFGTQQGTIGPFFRFETDRYIYLLTSAHVLLNKEQMRRLITDNQVYYGMFGTDSYQPPEGHACERDPRHHLGKTEFAVYREGGQNTSGMEIALVRIDNNRIPVDGQIPDGTNLRPESDEKNVVFEFSIGQDCSLSTFRNDPHVYKVGSGTGLTKGRVRLHGGSVRTSTLNDDYLGGQYITLYEQIEIESIGDDVFGKQGDSGSLVFQKEGNSLVPVGIFEGKMDNVYMVTPIYDIKMALSKFMSLYRDPPTDTRMDFDEQIFPLTMKLYYIPSPRNESYSTIDRGISEEIRRQTSAMQTNILHYSEHNNSSVKAEIDAVKAEINGVIRHIDATKNEIIENLGSQIETSFRQFMQANNQGQNPTREREAWV